MTDDSREADPKSENSGLDFDRIKIEIDNLGTEIREDAAKRPADQVAIKKLSYDQRRLSEIVRDLRFQVFTETSSAEIVATRRLCLSIYEDLQEVVSVSSRKRGLDRRVGRQIEDSCDQAMDAASTFLAMLSRYESFPPDRSLSNMATDLEALSSARRKLLDQLRGLDEQLEGLVRWLEVT
jgi:hypothetical protein